MCKPRSAKESVPHNDISIHVYTYVIYVYIKYVRIYINLYIEICIIYQYIAYITYYINNMCIYIIYIYYIIYYILYIIYIIYYTLYIIYYILYSIYVCMCVCVVFSRTYPFHFTDCKLSAPIGPSQPPLRRFEDIMYIEDHTWLVVYLPLWKIWKSVGIIIRNIWKNKKCSKPLTRYLYLWWKAWGVPKL